MGLTWVGGRGARIAGDGAGRRCFRERGRVGWRWPRVAQLGITREGAGQHQSGASGEGWLEGGRGGVGWLGGAHRSLNCRCVRGAAWGGGGGGVAEAVDGGG